MNANKLGIGIPLSKEEQKQIKGGEPCPTGDYVECFCVNGNVDIGDPIMPIAACETACSSLGGYLSYQCVPS